MNTVLIYSLFVYNRKNEMCRVEKRNVQNFSFFRLRGELLNFN